MVAQSRLGRYTSWQAQGLPLQRLPDAAGGVLGCNRHLASGSTCRRGGARPSVCTSSSDLRLIGGVILSIPRRIVQVLQQAGELRKEAAGFLLPVKG